MLIGVAVVRSETQRFLVQEAKAVLIDVAVERSETQCFLVQAKAVLILC